MFSHSLLATFAIFFYTLTSVVLAQTCYLPDGTDRAKSEPNSTWVFCKSTAGTEHGMCCDGTAAGGSTCVGNGLCHYGSYNSLFREGCTDPTWQDPGCLKLYLTGTDDSGIPRAAEKVLLAGCDSTKYPNAPAGQLCPFGGPSFDKCCANNLGYKIGENASVMPSNATSTPSASASAANIAATATAQTSQANVGILPSSAPSSTQTNSSTSGSNGGAIAGGIVGGIALGALLAFAIWFFLRRRKQQAGAAPGSEAAPPAYTSNKPNGMVYSEKGSAGSSPAYTTHSEMPAWQANELPAGRQQFAAEMEAPHHGYHR